MQSKEFYKKFFGIEVFCDIMFRKGEIMKYKDRIEINSDILVGKPIIKGTRISVEFILELLSNGWSGKEILKNYPQLQREDILAAIEYALETIREERVYAI